MLTRLRRLLGVRREIQRRLDVNLEFDDLDGDAADVRNGARLALVSLRSWLDGAGEEVTDEPSVADEPPVQSDGIPHITAAPLRSECWFMLRGENKRHVCWLWATGRDEGDRAFFVRGLPTDSGGCWTMVRNRDIEPPPADGIYREPKDIPAYGQNGDTPKSTQADFASLAGNFGYSQL